MTTKLSSAFSFSFGDPGHIPALITDDASVSFVIQVLVDDGLHVSPFTHHASKVGPLQELGLTGDVWDAWLRETVRRFEAFYDLGRKRASVIRSVRPKDSRQLDKNAVRSWEKAGRQASKAVDREMIAAVKDLRDPVGGLVGPPTLIKTLAAAWRRFRKQRTLGPLHAWAAFRKSRREAAPSTDPGWPLEI